MKSNSIFSKYNVTSKQINLIKNNIKNIPNKEKIAIFVAVYSATQNFAKSMLFLSNLSKTKDLWIVLVDNFSIDYYTISRMKTRDRETYEQEMFLFTRDLANTFGVQFLDCCMGFLNHESIYLDVLVSR